MAHQWKKHASNRYTPVEETCQWESYHHIRSLAVVDSAGGKKKDQANANEQCGAQGTSWGENIISQRSLNRAISGWRLKYKCRCCRENGSAAPISCSPTMPRMYRGRKLKAEYLGERRVPLEISRNQQTVQCSHIHHDFPFRSPAKIRPAFLHKASVYICASRSPYVCPDQARLPETPS